MVRKGFVAMPSLTGALAKIEMGKRREIKSIGEVKQLKIGKLERLKKLKRKKK